MNADLNDLRVSQLLVKNDSTTNGRVYVANLLDVTSGGTDGAMVVSGGIKVGKSLHTSGKVYISDTTAIVGGTGGALVVAGSTNVSGVVRGGLGFDANSHRIINVQDPTQDMDAINKRYLTQVLSSREVRVPLVLTSSTRLVTTSNLYVPYLTGTIDEANDYKITMSCTFTCENIIAIRLLIDGVVVRSTIRHAPAYEAMTWSIVINNFSIPTVDVPVSLQVASMDGRTVTIENSTIVFAVVDQTSSGLTMSSNQSMLTSSTGNVEYLVYEIPEVFAGTYRLGVSYTWTTQNLIRTQIIVDGTVLNTEREHAKEYEIQDSTWFYKIIFPSTTSHTITLAFCSPDGRVSSIRNGYIELVRIT